MNHVSKTIKDKTSRVFKTFKDKVMGLYNTPDSRDMNIFEQHACRRCVKIDHKSRANLMIGMIG